MERRSFLATTGAGLGALLAGCLSASGDAGDDGATPTDRDPSPSPNPSPSPTATDEPPKKPTATDGPGTPGGTGDWTPAGPWNPAPDPPDSDVSVEDVVVRKATTYESIMGSGGVLAAEGRQYVVASVRGGSDLSSDMFAFVTDDGSWDPGLTGTVGALNYAVAGHEGGSVGDPLDPDGPAFLAFEVPSPLDASNPRIRFSGGDDATEGETETEGEAATGGMSGVTWSLPDAAAEALAAPSASFELESLQVPDGVSQGDPLEVSLTVRNTSGVDGRFLAALYWPTDRIADDDESHTLKRVLAAGERATLSTTIDTEYTAMENRTVTLKVDGHVSASRDVDLRGVETDS